MEKDPANNNVITYSELINGTVNDISSMCCNIDRYIPTTWDLKAGGGTKTGGNGSTASTSWGYVISSDDSILQEISSDTVETLLTSFLSDRGILDRSSHLITAKAMLNFFNNIAIFIAARLKVLTSEEDDNNYIFYDSRDIDYADYSKISVSDMLAYDPISKINDSTGLSETERCEFYRELLMTISKTQYRYKNSFTVKFVSCCSSSSCSSSSCSSSSCSCSSCSSSSNYIVYMKLS